jgi:glycosyltransferase involved in cell wall biosynthesis
MSASISPRIIWITWERQVRNLSMSRSLDIPLFEILSPRRGVIRYATSIWRTLGALRRERPRVVVCQNPSVVLVLLLLSVRSLFGLKVVVDAHYIGVDGRRRGKRFQRLLDWCNRSVDMVIVTNRDHAEHVERVGGVAYICQDPFPDLSRYIDLKAEEDKKVFMICSFDRDEPFMKAFEAASMIVQEGFQLYVSGNYRKAGIDPDLYPHIGFLGFVPEDEFYQHLFSACVVLDLTENDNCLVCGAYEALQAGKPLVLSRKQALMDYFTRGVVYTENHAEDIAAAIRRAYSERETLAIESADWTNAARRELNDRLHGLEEALRSL